jgi:exoribonuclease R
MRGAGYTAFDGQAPEQTGHGGVAAPYAHVTAPLRRLADRYATEVCLALFQSVAVPDWARAALAKLPKVMSDSDRVANAAGRGAIDLTEAVLLKGRIGERFEAAVVDVDEPKPNREPGGTIAIDDPPVRSRCAGALPIGERVAVKLVTADPQKRTVLFERA